MLALTPAAEAKIVYHHVHRVIGPGHNYSLDLNHDKIIDFNIQNSYVHDQTRLGDFLDAAPVAGNAVAGTYFGDSGTTDAYALRRGALIGPKKPFHGFIMASAYDGKEHGEWVNVSNRYLGLKFKVKGRIHHGWARLNVVDNYPRITATLTGYAYETVPNKPIVAGNTKGPDDVPLAPAGLGRLAQGSARRLATR